MFLRNPQTSLLSIAIPALLATLLSACGGGSGGASGTANPPTSVSISGSVGDGPIIGATITVMDAYGSIIATTISDDLASYQTEIPDNAAYPLIIAANGGTDLVSGTVPDFEMLSLIYDNSETNANINPFSTLIVKTAQAMEGGLNPANLELATQIIMKHMNFGLDTDKVPNPISTKIDEQNVATIVKSSEVLAEMIRRARKSLTTSGSTLDEDDIIEILASDLTDGVIDGAGRAGADPQVATIVHVVSGQVLIEALNNDLYVNGVPATTLMDNAIIITTPGATVTTRDTIITQEQLDQTRLAIKSAMKVDSTSNITEIPAILDTIPPGALSETAETLLDPDVSTEFEDAVTLAPYAPDDVQTNVNEEVRIEIATQQPPMVSLRLHRAHSVTSHKKHKAEVVWAAINATSCVATGTLEWNDTGALTGREKIGELSEDATFTLTCVNGSGQTTSKTLTVKATEENKPATDNTGETSSTSPENINIPGGVSNPTTGSTSHEAGTSQPGNTTPPATSGHDNSTPTYQNILLEWNPSAATVVGYKVNYGAAQDTVTLEIRDIPVTTANFDPQAPAIELDPVNDLGLQPGDNACFTVSAYNMDGVSSPSPAVCSII